MIRFIRIACVCLPGPAAIVDESGLLGSVLVVAQVLEKANFDPAELASLANEQATKDRLKEVTTEAVERGVFGAPSFFVGTDMFWGQDRIEQLKAALINRSGSD